MVISKDLRRRLGITTKRPLPTGMVMGAPVSVTNAPRTRPSVPSMAICCEYRPQSVTDPTSFGPQPNTDRSHDVLAKMLLVPLLAYRGTRDPGSTTYSDLKHKLLSIVLSLEGVEDRRKLHGVKFYVDAGR